MSRLLDRDILRLATPVLLWSVVSTGCGQKQDFEMGDELGPAVLGGTGSSRTQTTVQVETQQVPTTTTTKKPKTPKPLPNIVDVTQIVTATSGINGWTAADYPFTGSAVAIGQPVTNGLTPFSFSYSYPQNNYQFVEAHLVIDTSRDNSDTEAIFVDGVFSGRPPLANVNTTSPQITHSIYEGNGSATENKYYIDWALSHYKINTRNSFDLLVSDLLTGTDVTSIDVLKDGVLNVVTGDDSPVYQAYLVIKGRTISSSTLSCVTSDTYTFTNQYLHNDGNTVESAAFSGSVGTASQAWAAAMGTYAASEFYYDAPLPKVDVENVTIATAQLVLRLKRSAAGKSAIVINGIGVAETGFDKTTATDVVETWYDAGVATWEALLTTVPTTEVATNVTLDLNAMLGAEQVRTLLAQGKLNVSVAGNVVAYSSGLTENRTYSAPINGPELKLEGTYFTEVCTVPDDPTSPLTQDGIVIVEEVEDEEVTEDGSSSETVVTNDGAGPLFSSVSATEITSTAATILWLTDEPSTSQVRYGIGNTSSATPVDSTMTTYHQVRLTGLVPYKYYSFQAVSVDKYGNESVSDITVFVTLR